MSGHVSRRVRHGVREFKGTRRQWHNIEVTKAKTY